VYGIQMRDHIRPRGFWGLVRDDETDAAHHAAGNDGPALVAVTQEAVDVGSRDRIDWDFVIHLDLLR
jgi:hypothetical protein